MNQTSEAPYRKCENCAGEMKMLGRLPRRASETERVIFRCSGCDHVVQEKS